MTLTGRQRALLVLVTALAYAAAHHAFLLGPRFELPLGVLAAPWRPEMLARYLRLPTPVAVAAAGVAAPLVGCAFG